nr:hypothetical protein [Tanacetum cinerariifolium]GEY34520.1 hypothetical protein [Tanacetum cinerariifolium]
MVNGVEYSKVNIVSGYGMITKEVTAYQQDQVPTKNVQRAYTFLEVVHKCSNEFDEKARSAYMFLEEYSYILTNLMRK